MGRVTIGVYLTIEEQAAGLIVRPTTDGQELLEEGATDFAALFEDFAGNGWTMLDPEQIGALTSSPIIVSPDVEIDDYGNVVKCDTVYWHERYQLEDAVEQLRTEGQVFLLKAR